MISDDQNPILNDKKTLPFVTDCLPDVFQKKAETELYETPEKRVQGLQELKEMAKTHMITSGIDFVDDFLLQFLRHRKHNVSRAFTQFVNFVKFRKNYNTFFKSIDFDKCFPDPSATFATVLPRRCPDGCAIILIEFGKWEPEKISIEELTQLLMLLFCQVLRDPMTQVNGFKVIYDFTNTSFKHLRYCTPYNLYLLYHGGLECIPGRYKQFHVVNDSLAMKAAWGLVRGFLSQKIKNRVFFSSSPKDLLEYFPRCVLPVQYGGDVTDYHMFDWLRAANENQKHFMVCGQSNYY